MWSSHLGWTQAEQVGAEQNAIQSLILGRIFAFSSFCFSSLSVEENRRRRRCRHHSNALFVVMATRRPTDRPTTCEWLISVSRSWNRSVGIYSECTTWLYAYVHVVWASFDGQHECRLSASVDGGGGDNDVCCCL